LLKWLRDENSKRIFVLLNALLGFATTHQTLNFKPRAKLNVANALKLIITAKLFLSDNDKTLLAINGLAKSCNRIYAA
jgi:hypothetical protein